MNHNRASLALRCVSKGALPFSLNQDGAVEWVKDTAGSTILMRAAQCVPTVQCTTSAVPFIMSKVPEPLRQEYVNAVDKQGSSALSYAVFADYHQAVKDLIAAKADVNISGGKPLSLAVKNNNVGIVLALLKAGATATDAQKEQNSDLWRKVRKTYEAERFGSVPVLRTSNPGALLLSGKSKYLRNVRKLVKQAKQKALNASDSTEEGVVSVPGVQTSNLALIARPSEPTTVAIHEPLVGPQIPANTDTFLNIYQAIRSNDCQAVGAFVERNGIADLDDALKIAIGNGSNQVIPLLIKRGARISQDHVTIARRNGNTGGAKLLESLLQNA